MSTIYIASHMHEVAPVWHDTILAGLVLAAIGAVLALWRANRP